MSSAISTDAIHPYIADIWQYVDSVLDGERPANRYERLAVERFVNDLNRSGHDGFAWWLCWDQVIRVISFMEKFPHVKGDEAKKRGANNRLKLAPWQKFIVANIFGWVDKLTGLRRFREAAVYVPRKNGKSTLAAAIGLYMLAADGEPGAEVYSGATSEKQAWEVFRPAKKMAERKPGYRSHYKVSVHAKHLSTKDGSEFKPVIGKPGDGASPSCSIIDEYHEHPDDSLYSTMDTGMLARSQPLLMVITTAGDNLEGVCHKHQKNCQQVLDGKIVDEHLFAIIFTIDAKGVTWDSDEAIEMANPNFGISIKADILRHKRDQAKNNPVKAAYYKTKHLNIWVGSLNAWMNMVWWDRQATELTRSDLSGCRNVSALDLSSKDDFTVRMDMYERLESDGNIHYYLFGKYYLPEETATDIEHLNHSLYQGFIESGCVVLTEGNIIDYDEIEQDAIKHAEDYQTEVVGYDDWGATETAQRIEKAGIDTVEVAQTTKGLSEPMKFIFAMVKAGRLHHENSPVLNWMMSNVMAREDANENVFPRKENRQSKIDGAVGSIMCQALLMGEPEEEASPELIIL